MFFSLLVAVCTYIPKNPYMLLFVIFILAFIAFIYVWALYITPVTRIPVIPMIISNLGFLEFTDVYYDFSEPENDAINLLKISSEDLKKELADSNDFSTLFLKINEDNKVTFKNEIINFIELLELNSSISEDLKITPFIINLYFEKNLRFQDYISIKSELSKFYSDHVKIDANEFIY
jgi:hypothetical protein